jgi:hypothetical protein
VSGLQLRPTKTAIGRKAGKRFCCEAVFLPFGTASPKTLCEATLKGPLVVILLRNCFFTIWHSFTQNIV